MAIILIRNTIVLVKLESVLGQDALPVEATDALLANAVTINTNPDIQESEEFSGSLDVGNPIVGGTPMEISIQVYLKGSGTAGTEPETDPLYKIAGLDATVVPSTSVTYAPISLNIPSATIYVFEGSAKLWKFTGARADMGGTLTTRQAGVLDFSCQARFSDLVDQAPSGELFQQVTRPIWRNGTFTINSQAAALQQFTFALNNTIALPDDPNDPEGFQPPEITGRDIQGTMNPLTELVATRNLFADLRANTLQPAQAVLGTVAGNICTVDVPQMKLRNVGPGNRDGFATDEVNYSAFGTDDGLTLAFT